MTPALLEAVAKPLTDRVRVSADWENFHLNVVKIQKIWPAPFGQVLFYTQQLCVGKFR